MSAEVDQTDQAVTCPVPMIVNVFLPQRQTVLVNFLNGQCTGASVADDGTNLGGGAVDAPN